jgi:hypothetical protein
MSDPPGMHAGRCRPRAAPARKEVGADMDMGKLVLFLLAVYGTWHSAKTAWRLGNELFG